MICGNFVIVDVDAQNGLEIAFQSFGNMPQTLSWFTAPLFVTAACLRFGRCLYFNSERTERTLDIQIAVFFVEIKYCVVQNIHCHSYATDCVLCIHLQELPKTTPVSIKLPSDLFGDMMMVLEFLNIFGNLFDIKDEFPSGLTFGNVFTIDILFIQSDHDIDVILL